MQHEIVKGPGDRGGLWVGFDVFCLSLMTVAFLQHPFSIICVCVCVSRQGSLAGLETSNTSHQAECWYILAGAGSFLYTTSLPRSPGYYLEGKSLSTESSRETGAHSTM